MKLALDLPIIADVTLIVITIIPLLGLKTADETCHCTWESDLSSRNAFFDAAMGVIPTKTAPMAMERQILLRNEIT